MKSNYHFKFEELLMYQKAIEFGEEINKQIVNFPKEETYRLSSQFIRAADSIALNIAEGSSDTMANFNRYLQIAWGSGNECIVCSTKAYLRGYISSEIHENNRENITALNKMIASYKNYLKREMNKESSSVKDKLQDKPEDQNIEDQTLTTENQRTSDTKN